MEDFTCLWAILFVSIIFGISWVFQFYWLEHKTSAWGAFAYSLGLSFVPGEMFSSVRPHVTGSYRKHLVTLETDQVSRGKSSQTFTSVKVVFNPRPATDTTDLATTIKAKDIVSLLDPNRLRYNLSGSVTVQPGELDYREAGVQSSPQQLTSIMDYLIDIAVGYPQLVALGSEAVRDLLASTTYDDTLKPIARQIARDIGDDTTRRYLWQLNRVICMDCLTTFASHKESVGFLKQVTYVGCRLCRQSRRHYQAKRVVLTVNNKMEKEIVEGQDTLQINWLQRRALCDFNEVHILSATDEDVERLAVLIGNDTDPERTEQYEHMTCTVDPTCPLSENTLRILRRTFGEVVVG